MINAVAFSVAVAFSCFVFLAYGYKLPPDAKEFLYQALPQWIQAFGVAVGAYYVYKWREQEQSKTRATKADLLLSDVLSTTKFLREIRTNRHYATGTDVGPEFIWHRVEEFKPKLPLISAKVEELLEHVAIVEERFGEEVANNLCELREIVNEMHRSHDTLRFIIERPQLLELAEWKQALRTHLNNIGVVLWNYEQPGTLSDEINDRIYYCEKKLRKSLAKAIKLQT